MDADMASNLLVLDEVIPSGWDNSEVMVCGGGIVYELFADLVDKCYITTVDVDIECVDEEVKFPIDFGEDWVMKKLIVEDDEVHHLCDYQLYERLAE